METSFYKIDELHKLGFKRVGEDVMISRKASFYGIDKIEIGNHVRIDDFCILSGNIILKDYIHIAAYSALFGGEDGIIMESYSGLSSRVVIYTKSDDYSGNSMTNPTVPAEYKNETCGKVILEKHVIVGTGTSIMPNLTIGEGSSVGSMSLVNKSLDSWGIYAGVPCRRIKERSKKLLTLEQDMRAALGMREDMS